MVVKQGPPALTLTVQDTVGAGDAFFALAALGFWRESND